MRVFNQIQRWKQKFFAEYFECYADWKGGEATRLEIWILVSNYILKAKQKKLRMLYEAARERNNWNSVFRMCFSILLV